MCSRKTLSRAVSLLVLAVCLLVLFDTSAFSKAKTNPVKPVARRNKASAKSIPAKKPVRLNKKTIPAKPARDKKTQASKSFAEVEVRIDKQFTLDYLKGLPSAPTSVPKVLNKPARVVLQLPAEQVTALVKKGADIKIIRKFVLIDGSKPNTKDTKAITSCYGENQNWVYIPDCPSDWVSSDILISCAPGNATVTSIDVHYEIEHSYVGDLQIDLTNGDITIEHHLFDDYLNGGTYLNRTVNGITTFNGEPVNQWWTLWALDNYECWDDGYITYWWIRVYYEDVPCPPPANDECGSAIAVSENVPYYGNSDCATGTDITICADNDWADVWHSFTPATSGDYTISLCGSAFDTTLAVFYECWGTELVCNDDSDSCGQGSYQSEVLVTLNAGHTYLIRVSGYDGDTGDYTLLVTGDENNDECANAIAVLTNVPYNGSSVGATGTDITSCGNGDTADVWNSFTPATTGDYTISLCGSAFDTTLAVFSDCDGTELACNDNFCDLQSAVEVPLTAGNEYLIRVSGNGGATGNYTLLVTKKGDGVTNYYAVICGISEYLYDVVPDLTYCDDDARDVRDALLAWGNWQNSNITTLIDSAATKSAIHTAIQNMASIADEDDICLFYFSGHGTSSDDIAPYDESDGYDEFIVPYDTYYINDAISDDELGDWIGALPTNKYIVLLDACNSGGQIKGLGTLTAKGIGNIVPQKGDGFAADLTPVIAAKDLTSVIAAKDLDDNGYGVVLTACDDDEVCYESPSLQNSVFTYYLVQGMAGPADSDSDNLISAEECYTYTNPLATSYEPTQHAQIYDGYPGELDFLGFVPPPNVISWEIAATHGSAGEVWNAVDDGYVEPRLCGIKKLRVCFDTDMNTSGTGISDKIFIYGTTGGEQAVLGELVWESSTCMSFELNSVLPDKDAYDVTLTNEIKSALGVALEWPTVCLTALKGDANGDRSVTAGDLLAIRAHINQPVNSSTARYDINCDGFITSGDLLAARPFVVAQNSAPGCPSTR